MSDSEAGLSRTRTHSGRTKAFGNRLRKLCEEWKDFFLLVLAPWSFFSLLLIVLFGIAEAYVKQSNLATIQSEWISTVFTIVFGIASGILGGVLAKRWDDLTEKKVIAARGEGAIRGLILLSNNITSLAIRVGDYLSRHSDVEQNGTITAEVIRTYLEEVIRSCRVLNEEALSAIDNWKDAVPEANVREQVSIVQTLQVQIDELREQAVRKNAQLQTLQANDRQSKAEIAGLDVELIGMIQKIDDLETQQRQQDSQGVGLAAIRSGSASFTDYSVPSSRPPLFFDRWIEEDKALRDASRPDWVREKKDFEDTE